MRTNRIGVGDGLYGDLKKYILLSPPKTPVATEKELCARYKISRVTVRRVMVRFLSEGLIYRIKGSGTFVSLHEKNKVSRETIVYCQWGKAFGHPFFSEMMRGILEKAEKNNINVNIIPYKVTPADNENAFLKAAVSPWVTGVIMPFYLKDLWEQVQKANPEVCMTTTTLKPEEISGNACSFTLDTFEFGRIAAKQLLKTGVDVIAYVGCDKEALSGIRDIAEAAGKTVREIHVPFSMESDFEDIVRRLSKYEGQGVVIGDDFLARKLFDAFHASRQNPLGKFKIVSYANKGDRTPLDKVVRVEFDGYEMGVKCVAMLRAMRADPVLKRLDIRLRPRLISQFLEVPFR